MHAFHVDEVPHGYIRTAKPSIHFKTCGTQACLQASSIMMTIFRFMEFLKRNKRQISFVNQRPLRYLSTYFLTSFAFQKFTSKCAAFVITCWTILSTALSCSTDNKARPGGLTFDLSRLTTNILVSVDHPSLRRIMSIAASLSPVSFRCSVSF